MWIRRNETDVTVRYSEKLQQNIQIITAFTTQHTLANICNGYKYAELSATSKHLTVTSEKVW